MKSRDFFLQFTIILYYSHIYALDIHKNMPPSILLFTWWQVKFEHKVFPAEMHIYQTQNAGAVKKIEAKQPDNQWYILWEAKSVENIQTNRPIIFSAEFNVSRTKCIDVYLHVPLVKNLK